MSPEDREATVEAWASTLTDTELEEALAFERANDAFDFKAARFERNFCLLVLEKEIKFRRDVLKRADDVFARAYQAAAQAKERLDEACDIFEGLLEVDEISQEVRDVFERLLP